MNSFIVYQNKKPFLRKIPIPYFHYKKNKPKNKPPLIPKGKILVKIYYASLNPADYKTADGEQDLLINFQYPRVLGFDFSGQVVRTHGNSSKFNKNDLVFGMIKGLPEYQSGTLSEYALIDESICAKCPSSLSLKDCAAIPLVGITVKKAFDKCRLKQGERVLIIGGSGGIGTMAIQFAKNIYKASHIVTTASNSRKIRKCQELGANRVINYRLVNYHDFLKKEMEKGKEEKFDVILDCVGDALKACDLLAENGRLCSIVVSPTIESIREWILEQNMEHKIKSCLGKIIQSNIGGCLFEFFNEAKSLKNKCNRNYFHVIGGGNGKIMNQLRNYIENGQIKAVIGHEFPLIEIEKAFKVLRKGGVLGKIVIKI